MRLLCYSKTRCVAWQSLTNLDSYRGPYVWSLWQWQANSRGVGRVSFVNDVKQHLTDLSCAGTDRVALFILQGVDRSVRVER